MNSVFLTLLLRDLRAFRGRLLALHLTVALLACLPWWGLGIGNDTPSRLSEIHAVLMIGVLIAVAVLAAEFTATNSPRHPAAFWRTRAISPATVFLEKLGIISAGLIAGPLLVMAAAGASLGIPLDQLGIRLAEVLALFGVLALGGLLAAALWRRRWLGLIIMLGAIFAWNTSDLALGSIFERGKDEARLFFDYEAVVLSARWMAGGVLAVGILWAVFRAFKQPAARPAWRVFLCTVALSGFCLFFWPWALFSDARPRADTPRPLEEAGRLTVDNSASSPGLWLKFTPHPSKEEVRVVKVATADGRTTLNPNWLKRQAIHRNSNSVRFPVWLPSMGARPAAWSGLLELERFEENRTQSPATPGEMVRAGASSVKVRRVTRTRDELIVEFEQVHALGAEDGGGKTQLAPWRLVWDETLRPPDESSRGGVTMRGVLGYRFLSYAVIRLVDGKGRALPEEQVDALIPSLRLERTERVVSERFVVRAALPLNGS